MTHKASVLVATPHAGNVSPEWSMGLRVLRTPKSALFTEVHGHPYDVAREKLASECLEADAEWLFFLDSDVICPPDGLLRLLSLEAPVSSGIYRLKSPPYPPDIFVKEDKKYSCVTKIPNEPFQADYVGAGCLLIHQDVLKKLSRPWFYWTDNREEYGAGEDFYFFEKLAKELDVKPLIDPAVFCSHLGMFAVTETGIVPAPDGLASACQRNLETYKKEVHQ